MPSLKKFLLPALLLLTHANALFARAGGGGSFHSGGGGHSFGGGGGGSWGGGSSHSYGGGSSSPMSWTELLIILIIIAIYIAYQVYKQYNASFSDDSSNSSNDNNTPSRPTIQPNALNLLQQSDPTFNPAQFYARIQTAFLNLQAAWSNQNLDPVRPFISDAILERFNIQFSEQQFLGYRNSVTNPTVQSITLVQTLSDHLYDTAIVRIHAAATDTNLTPAGQPFYDNPGNSSQQPFTEYWSFLRKRGAKSVATGLIEGNCPNCGGAVDINQNANCPHCKAALKNAQYDWVLTEITQDSQFELTTPSQIPGLSTLLQRDPNFTTTDLEDRASVIFWRLSLADRTASTNPLRKVVPTPFLHTYALHFAPDNHGTRHLYLDAGVGSVTTLALRPNVPDPSNAGVPPASPTPPPPACPLARPNPGIAIPGPTLTPPPIPNTSQTSTQDSANESHDYALLEITWSGILYDLTPAHPPHRTTQDNLLHSWYILKRSATATTDPETTLSSTHCPNCGAPLTTSASPACDFCNTPLTDGTHGWLLTKITPKNDPTLRQFFLNQRV